MKNAFCILFVFLLFKVEAQRMILEGTTFSKNYNVPLPFANVYLKGDYRIGTVSNEEGKFKLSIPENVEDSIIFSFVGFKKRAISTLEVNTGTYLNIKLEEQEKILGEVIIMPDDTLLNILKNAFSKIEINYPTDGTLITGFYRETNQLIPENKFLYFAESSIEFFKPSYSNKQYGPVRIIEGGKVELPSRLKYSNVYFFAGPYAPQKFDFVKDKKEFINPKYFHFYNYEITGQTINNGKEVYVIKFTPKENALYEGNFFLEKNSLAYVSAEYKLSLAGVKKWNERNSLTSLVFEKSKYHIRYRLIDGLWQIDLVIHDGVAFNKKYSNRIRYTSEYVSTSFRTADKNPIKESEAIAYSEIYTQQESKFDTSFWKKPEIVSRTSKLDSTIEILFKRNELKIQNEILPTHYIDSSQHVSKFKKLITKIALKTSSGISIGIAPINVNAGNFLLTYKSHFSIQKEVHERSFIPTFGYSFKYFLAANVSITSNFLLGLSSETKFSMLALGIEYRKKVFGWKRPLYFITGISPFYSTANSSLGSVKPTEPFSINGSTFDASKISVAIGESRFGILPSVQFDYKFRPKFSLYSTFSTSVLSKGTDKIFIEEKTGFFLSRKSSSFDLSEDGFTLLKNGLTQSATNTHIQDFRLFINVGIRLGLK